MHKTLPAAFGSARLAEDWPLKLTDDLRSYITEYMMPCSSFWYVTALLPSIVLCRQFCFIVSSSVSHPRRQMLMFWAVVWCFFFFSTPRSLLSFCFSYFVWCLFVVEVMSNDGVYFYLIPGVILWSVLCVYFSFRQHLSP